ncbi:MAG: hypothetical protein WCO96_00205 [Actinomycetes bacterium]
MATAESPAKTDVTVTAESPSSVDALTPVPSIGFTSAPPTSSADWTTQPTCAVYAATDTGYATPLTGALADGSYTTHCSGGSSTNYNPSSYVDGSLTVTAIAAPGSFTGVPTGPTNATGATIGFTLAQPGGSVECRLDSGDWTPCTTVSGTSGSFTVSGLAAGSHSVSVRQSPPAGTAASATTSSWTVQSVSATAPSLDTGSANVGKGSTIKASGYSISGVAAGSPSPVFSWQMCRVLNDASSCSSIGGPSSHGAWWGTRDANIGHQVRLRVSWTSLENFTVSLFSALSGVITPINVSGPVLNFGGSNTHPVKGTSIHSSFGVWGGWVTGVSTSVFQWQRCTSSSSEETCSDIDGATGQWYKPTSEDTGKSLRIKATVTTRGQSVTAYSAISGASTTNVLRRLSSKRTPRHATHRR